jgi:hypothetical protein
MPRLARGQACEAGPDDGHVTSQMHRSTEFQARANDSPSAVLLVCSGDQYSAPDLLEIFHVFELTDSFREP